LRLLVSFFVRMFSFLFGSYFRRASSRSDDKLRWGYALHLRSWHERNFVKRGQFVFAHLQPTALLDILNRKHEWRLVWSTQCQVGYATNLQSEDRMWPQQRNVCRAHVCRGLMQLQGLGRYLHFDFVGSV
jgi:hypothetical protein